MYFFGLFNGAVSEKTAKRVREVLDPTGAEMVTYDDPASGPRGWLRCENLGAPFDRQCELRALAALGKAGLWPIPVNRQ